MDVVELEIIDSIAKMLRDIKTSNNYLSTVAEVNKEEKSVEDMRQFPAVNIVKGITEYSDPQFSESGKHTKTLNVVLDCYLQGKENKQTILTKFLADLEIRFADDTIGGNTNFNQTATAYNLENKCLIVIFVNAVPFSVEGEKHWYGIELSMQVKFRQKRSDPTVLNP